MRPLQDWRHPLTWSRSWTTLFGIVLAFLAGLLLIRLSPLEGAALVGLLAIVVATLIEPMVGLGTALFVGPLKAYLSAELPQIPAQIGHAFVALALGSWLIRRLSEQKVHLDSTLSPLSLSLLGFLGAVLLSLWDAVDLVAYGIPELVKWVEILLLFVLVSECLTADTPSASRRGLGGPASRGPHRPLWWLMFTVLSPGVFQAMIGIWQFALRGEGPDHFRVLGGDFFRAYGTFEQPNPYGGYLGLTAALALGTTVGLAWERLAGDGDSRSTARDSERRKKGTNHPISALSVLRSEDWAFYVLGGGAALVMVVALVASWSRGAWIGFGSALLMMAAALPRKAIWSVLLVTALILGGIGLYVSGQLPAPIADRLTSFVQDIHLEDVRGVPINDANYAVVERLAHWQAALSMFRHRLWTGVGFGCYEAAYPTFSLINWPIALGHAHNVYLNLAAETGLIGLGAYLILWAVVIWQTWRLTRRARGLVRGIGVGLIGVWTHLSVHHLLDNLYVNNVHLHIGVLLGLAAFLIQWTNRTIQGYGH